MTAAVQRLIDRFELERRVPLKRERIRQLEAEDKFPKRVLLGERRIAWIESEVDAWMAERIAASRTPKVTV